MADDVLQVELEIDDGKATSDADKFFEALERKFGATDLDVSKNMAAGFEKAEKQALTLQGQFKSLAAFDPKGKALDWVSKTAVAAQRDVAGINARLQAISKLATQTTSKSLLAIYSEDAKLLNAELDKSQQRLQRLQQARFNTPVGGRAGAGGGKALDLGGLGGIIGQVAPAGVGVENLELAASGAKLLGIGTAGLAAFGALAAAGVGIVKISEKIEADAKRILALETAITGARNKQIIAGQDSLKNLVEQRKEAERARNFAAEINKADDDELKRKKALSQKLLDLNPTGTNADTIKKEILEIEAKLVFNQAAETKELDAIFAQRNVRFLKAQADEAVASRKSSADAYKDVLSDDNLTVGKLQDGLKKLRSGVGGLLFDESKSIIKQYEDALQAMQEKAEGIRNTIGEALTNAAAAENPLVKLMVDFETATERAEQRFKGASSSIIQQMAAIDRAAIQAQINQSLFNASKGALQQNQAANRLDALPQSATNGFQRNLNFLQTEAGFAQASFQNQQDQRRADFLRSGFNPNNPKTFNQDRFGSNVSDFRAEAGDAFEEINKLRGISTADLGAQGKSLIAEKIKNITDKFSEEQLLVAITSGGADAFAARNLLADKGEALGNLQAGAQSRFNDALTNQRAAEQSRKDALELIKNVDSSKLTDPQKIKELLAITGDLGDAELTPELKKARSAALRQDAVNQVAEAREAAKQAAAIQSVMQEIDKQLKAQGLKVTLGETPIVQVEVKDSSLSATQRALGTRATPQSTQRMQE